MHSSETGDEAENITPCYAMRLVSVGSHVSNSEELLERWNFASNVLNQDSPLPVLIQE